MSLIGSGARLIREHIAKQRNDNGLTQAQLAEAIGKGEKYLSKVETGSIGTPSLETLAQIEEKLKRPFSYLFFTDGFGESAEELRAKIDELIASADLPTLRRYYRLLLICSEKD
jgi:transcriptional regulator with XRE-family HTH domain